MWLKKIIISILLPLTIVSLAQPPKKFYSTYGGNGYDVGYDVKQTLDNGYIITGSTSSFGQGNTDLYLLKIDSMGQKKFQTSFGGYNNEIGKSIVQLSDSSFVMVGYTSSSGIGGYDIFLVKTDKTGNLLWQKTIGGSDWDFAYSIQKTTDGGFIIGGTTYSFGRGNADGYVIKTDANGDVIWSKTYGGKKDDEFKSVIQTSDGNYALTGYTKSYNDSLSDIWIFKIDINGDSLWCKFFGGNKQDFGSEIIEHQNGEFFIAGGTESFSVSIMNGYVVHTDNFGNYLSKVLDNTSSSYQSFNSIVVSKRSNGIINALAKETFYGFSAQFKMLEMNLGLNYLNGTDYGSTFNDEMYKIIATNDKGYACVGYTNGYGAINSDVYFLKCDSNLVGSVNVVSVKENNYENIKVDIFPNPAINELKIKTNTNLNLNEIRLYDISGNEISIKLKLKHAFNNYLIIDVTSIDNGIYFLSYLNFTKKISIVK